MADRRLESFVLSGFAVPCDVCVDRESPRWCHGCGGVGFALTESGKALHGFISRFFFDDLEETVSDIHDKLDETVNDLSNLSDDVKEHKESLDELEKQVSELDELVDDTLEKIEELKESK